MTVPGRNVDFEHRDNAIQSLFVQKGPTIAGSVGQVQKQSFGKRNYIIEHPTPFGPMDFPWLLDKENESSIAKNFQGMIGNGSLYYVIDGLEKTSGCFSLGSRLRRARREIPIGTRSVLFEFL